MAGRTTLVLAVLLGVANARAVRAESRPIDAARSTLDVLVGKSGLLSALADNHVIRAPIDEGLVTSDGDLSVALTVSSARLTVADQGLSAEKRAEVAMRMHGPDVLDSATYPAIRFVSGRIIADGADRWRVAGELALRGVSRQVSGVVILKDGHYRGTITIRQSDLGIRPISIAGGAVKVKDELHIVLDIVTISP